MRNFNKDIKPNERLRKRKDEWLKKANTIWGDEYDYSKFEYLGACYESIIICKKHGEFNLPPTFHIKSSRPQGCPKCKTERLSNEIKIRNNNNSKEKTEDFVRRSKEKFGKQFDYTDTVYFNSDTKVRVKCNKCEESYLINPGQHLRFGCSKCGCTKSLKENLIRDYLKEKGIKYFWQHSFDDCKYNNTLPFDFYIPSMNMVIEYNGKHHYEYEPFLHNGNIENFLAQQERDSRKREFCELNGINFIEIAYDDNFFGTLESLFVRN